MKHYVAMQVRWRRWVNASNLFYSLCLRRPHWAFSTLATRQILSVVALSLIFGCDHSELWRHRQETNNIQGRLPEKERYLENLKSKYGSLQQQKAGLYSEIQANEKSLEELSRQSDSLEHKLEAARVSRTGLSVDIQSLRARHDNLKEQITALQKEQKISGQMDATHARRISELKKELDTLLKIIAQQ